MLLTNHTYQVGSNYYTITRSYKTPTGQAYDAIFHGIKRNHPYNNTTQLHEIMLIDMWIKDVTN